MKKWNMIIDVAECTNCQLCALSAMDEYVGNEWPGVAAPMPRHGHQWIDIKQKERGQAPMIDIAYVPTMCNHCDNAPCLAKGGDAVKKRDDGIVIIDPVKAKGRKDLVESCPYGHIWWNEELQLPQIWPFDAHLLDQGWQQTRGQQACPTGAMRAIKVEDDEMARMARDEKPRGDEARGRHQAARLLPQPVALQQKLHRRQRGDRGGRRRRLRRGRERAPDQGRPDGRAAPPPTTTATSNSTSSTRTPAATPSRSSGLGRTKMLDASLGASVFLGEIRL